MSKEITQSEANDLIAVEKHRANEDQHSLIKGGKKIIIPIKSPIIHHEDFILDITPGRINLARITLQNRVRTTIVLLRLDLNGAPHRNPPPDDLQDIPPCHLHIYREGFGDKYAIPLPPDKFRDPNNFKMSVEDFLRYTNITLWPHIDYGIFINDN